MMPNVIGNRLLFTMAEAPLLGYYECGDNSKTPPSRRRANHSAAALLLSLGFWNQPVCWRITL